MAPLSEDAAKRLVEARARRMIQENRDDLLGALELGRAFLPELSRRDAKALQQLAAIAASPADAEADASSALERIRGLSTVQVRQVASIAFQSLDSPSAAVRELAVELLRDVSLGRAEPLGSKIQGELREKAIFEPALLYRDAGVAETRAFVRMLDRETDPSRLHELLSCLAWTRSDLAVETFRGWIKDPPGWAAGLTIPLGDYPPLAGWRLNAEGERVELIAEQ